MADNKLFAPVSGLLFWGGPSAIAWLVIAFVIYPVNGEGSSGAFAHIGIKGIERISPSFADGNPPPPIAMPPSFFGVVAPGFHTKPGIVSDGLGVWSPVSCGLAVCRDGLFLKAAATKVLPHSEVAGPGNRLLSAIALAPPNGFWTTVRYALNHKKPSDFFACEVNECAHA